MNGTFSLAASQRTDRALTDSKKLFADLHLPTSALQQQAGGAVGQQSCRDPIKPGQRDYRGTRQAAELLH
jgi:hypothetical protein